MNIMKIKNFKEYQTSTNADGSVNILKVPIFKTGTHKGMDFNDALVAEIINNHNELKKDDYFSSVIIGHNEDDNNIEKEAEGFLDNLNVEDGTIFADLIKIDSATFESKIKKRKYPHRSVEFNPVKKIFSALALLGGTAPHHKLPIMEFANDDEHKVFEMEFKEEAPDIEAAIEMDNKLQGIRNIWWKIMQFVDKVMFDKEKSEGDKQKEAKALLEQGTKLLAKEVKNFKEEDMKPTKFTEEQITAFTEEHGVAPEEAVNQLKTFRDNEKKRLADAKKNGIRAFCEALKKDKHIAPVVVDEFIGPYMESVNGAVVKFKDGEKPALEAFENTINKILELAGEDKLVVPFDEETEQGENGDGPKTAFDDNENVDEESLKLHKKALSFMDKDSNLTYEKAVYKASEI